LLLRAASAFQKLAKKVEEELPFGVEVMNFASIDLRENVFLTDARTDRALSGFEVLRVRRRGAVNVVYRGDEHFGRRRCLPAANFNDRLRRISAVKASAYFRG
jgi:hypothetical protein